MASAHDTELNTKANEETLAKGELNISVFAVGFEVFIGNRVKNQMGKAATGVE